MINTSFEELMNGMVELKTKVASLQNGSICRGPEDRKLVRQDISPPKKSIAENIDDEVEDCIMNMV
jgi:hypothetical protein